jgi:hypothetical protein
VSSSSILSRATIASLKAASLNSLRALTSYFLRRSSLTNGTVGFPGATLSTTTLSAILGAKFSTTLSAILGAKFSTTLSAILGAKVSTTLG